MIQQSTQVPLSRFFRAIRWMWSGVLLTPEPGFRPLRSGSRPLLKSKTPAKRVCVRVVYSTQAGRSLRNAE